MTRAIIARYRRHWPNLSIRPTSPKMSIVVLEWQVTFVRNTQHPWQQPFTRRFKVRQNRRSHVCSRTLKN